MKLIGIKSRKASERKVDINTKNKVLNFYAKLLDKEKKLILKENLKDVKFAKNKGIKENLIRRLEIDEIKLKNISNSINKISKLKDPVNVTLKKWSRPNGLNIKRVTIPIGVIGVIFESRPNVTSDVAGLCFKSGNAVILKGGSEAINTNRILAKLFRLALKKNNVDENYIQFVDSKNRKMVDIMLSKMKKVH
jgi:glutamate-5-semialdehyde dehydrogenase